MALPPQPCFRLSALPPELRRKIYLYAFSPGIVFLGVRIKSQHIRFESYTRNNTVQLVCREAYHEIRQTCTAIPIGDHNTLFINPDLDAVIILGGISPEQIFGFCKSIQARTIGLNAATLQPDTLSHLREKVALDQLLVLFCPDELPEKGFQGQFKLAQSHGMTTVLSQRPPLVDATMSIRFMRLDYILDSPNIPSTSVAPENCRLRVIHKGGDAVFTLGELCQVFKLLKSLSTISKTKPPRLRFQFGKEVSRTIDKDTNMLQVFSASIGSLGIQNLVEMWESHISPCRFQAIVDRSGLTLTQCGNYTQFSSMAGTRCYVVSEGNDLDIEMLYKKAVQMD